jgi:FtsH-binding integral membrane protein
LSKSSTASSSSSTSILVGAGVAWGVVSLLFFLLFSAPGDDGVQPEWFLLGINFLETGAFLIAAILCFRNWKSTQIVSGRSVWLWIGMGLLAYTLGNVLFFLWGNVWGLDPAVSLGDFFYILSYVFLAAGMFKAVLPRRLNLSMPQWLIVVGIGVAGILLALFVNISAVEAIGPGSLTADPPQWIQATETTAPIEPTAPAEASPVEAAEVPETNNAPDWVASLDQAMEPLENFVGILYILGDIVLLIIAGTLLVAFWGGRFSQSWKLIAIAAFCLYIADMFFAFALNTDNYIEGSLWEVFWTFSAVFFWLGAVVEYGISVSSRRSVRRRKG